MTVENKKIVKEIKKVALEFSENLVNRAWDAAFDSSQVLNTLLKSGELGELTGNELETLGISAIKDNLRKYFYFNGEVRKFQGAMVAKGKQIQEVL